MQTLHAHIPEKYFVFIRIELGFYILPLAAGKKFPGDIFHLRRRSKIDRGGCAFLGRNSKRKCQLGDELENTGARVIICVLTIPGCTAFAVIFVSRNLFASSRVNKSTRSFDAEYAAIVENRFSL